MIRRPMQTMSITSLVLVLAVITRQVFGVIQDCVEIPAQPDFKMEDAEGNWYPMEIVLHRNDSKIYGVPTDTNCPTVTFTVSPKSKNTLIMVWNSTDGHLEYKFTQKGPKSQWQSAVEQSGKLTILTVEKDKYMIIRNCSTYLHNTVVLSKHSWISSEMLAEASNEIAKIFSFPTVEKKTLCANSNAAVSKSLPVFVVLASMSVLVLLVRP